MNLEELIKNYETKGMDVQEDGTKKIGKAEFIAPLAYIHYLFKPKGDEVQIIQEQLGISLPVDLVEFYKKYNGVWLFNSAITILGIRGAFSRSNFENIQPFDIIDANNRSKIFRQDDTKLKLGSYGWNGSEIFYNLLNNEIEYFEKDSKAFSFKWKNFNVFLNDEILRLKKLHTPEGKNTPFRPTVPIGGVDVLERMLYKERKNYIPYWLEETKAFMKKHNLTAQDLAEL